MLGLTAISTSRSMRARDYDIVVLGDFRFPGGTSTAIAEELAAGAAAGYRIGLVQIKGPVLKRPHPFHPRIRACIDDGRVALVDPDQPVEGRLLLAHHPSLFTHRPAQGLHVAAERKLLVVWHPPLDGAGAPAYDWAEIDRNGRGILGEDLLWAPVGPLVRSQFESIEDAPQLLDTDWHSMVDLPAWQALRDRFVDVRPVIGRHSRPDLLKWPDSRELTLAAYPDDQRYLVRVLGGGPYLLSFLGAYPRNWQVHGFNAMPAERFLETIDFFVYFHHSRWVEAFGRTIIEAMASGALAILAPHFRPLFGDAAIYAEPEDVRDLVDTCRADARRFREQIERGWEAVRTRFSHAAYVERLQMLIGPPRRTAAAVPRTVKPRPLRVLFMSSNGIGVGHLTRLLAIARRCPAPLEPVFLTLSQAVRVVREQGFLAEYLPFHTYLGCDIGRWNAFLREELNELISFYDPRVVVFDGHVPYGGLVSALDDNRQAASIWCRRSMWGAHKGADQIKRETHFDAVVEPGDLAEHFDRGLTTQYRDRTRPVAPIRLLDTEEILARDAARDALHLRRDDPAVLLMLGSGNNFDYEPVRKVVLARLGKASSVQVVVAEWLIAEQTLELPAHVMRLAEYPISRYLAAFDFAISAVGYNSFHELLFAGVPTIFIPNENPQQDDQLGRAMFAACHGLGLCVRRSAIYRLGPAIDELLDGDLGPAIRARCATLVPSNGALEAARVIEEMAYMRRADRP
jgi:hypothetical protein